jgi:phosphoribosylaminoimidazole-succinocarboxamide synthase
MTEEFIQSVSDRYIELYERVTGKTFVKADESDLTQRIEANVIECLKNR